VLALFPPPEQPDYDVEKGALERHFASSSAWEGFMPTDQYHEPPGDLTPEIRTFARLAASLQEEAEAIGWYEQRMSLERNPEAKAIMEEAQEEEFKHFAMALEFLSRRKPKWQAVLQAVLFKPGDIVEHGAMGEQAEKDASDS
jgi:hypothetical protein